MSLLRYDFTTNDWVIFAPERGQRPHEFKKAAGLTSLPQPPATACPFCPGNERMTEPEIYALRGGTPPNTLGWSVRVIPNKFLALRIEEDVHRVEEGPLFR